MKFNIEILNENESFIATCPELEINCFADSKDNAMRRIKEVIKFYLESAKEMGFEVSTGDSFLIDGEAVTLAEENNTISNICNFSIN